MFPFRWIREDKWSTEPAQVIVLEFNPAHVVPAISVQPDWNNSLGIVRGVKKGEYLIEDHIREKLSYYGPPINIKEPIMGADQIRKQVWTVDEHLERFKATNQSQIVRGWVGNGNLLSNPHFVGLAHDRCYHLKTEEFKGKAYSSLVVRKTNDGRYAVAIENLTYEPDTAQPHCPTQVTKSGRIEYATFGQHIVRNGQPIDDQQLIDMAKSQQFYDLRHLFLFGRIPMGEKRWLDAGLGAFWNNGKMCVQQVENALKHQPILVNVSQFSDEDIHSAMYAKGYSKVSEPKSAGEYSLNCGTMKVILLDGVYPHNMIGIKEDGHVISVVIKGLSNRVGVSIQGAAYVMKKLGARDALLLDNGGDVMMSFEGEQVLGSAEGERKKLRSVLLFRQVSEKTNLMAEDLRLEVYPRQFRIQQSV